MKLDDRARLSVHKHHVKLFKRILQGNLPEAMSAAAHQVIISQ